MTKFSLYAYGQNPETGLNFSISNFNEEDLKSLVQLGLLDHPKLGALHLAVDKSLYFVPYLFLDDILHALGRLDYEDSFWNLSPCGLSEYLNRKAYQFSHIKISNDKNCNEVFFEDFPLTLKRDKVVFNADYTIWGKNRFYSYVQMSTGFGEFLLSDLYDEVLAELARV